jgi:hypothetical protein
MIRIRIQEAQKHVDPADPDPDPQHWLPGQLCVWRGLVPHSQVVADHQVTRSANNTPDIDTFKKSKDRGEKKLFSYLFL